MPIAIVPNCVSEQINKKIDHFLEQYGLKLDREQIYKEMLMVYDEHGIIADIIPKHKGGDA